MTGSRLPRALYRAEQVRELDRIAIEECGIEGFSLMHKAATVAFNGLLERWPQVRHLIVFAGPGNNGGDGYVLAALARDHGLNSEVVQLGDHESLRGDAQRAREFALDRAVRIKEFDQAAILGDGGYPSDHTVVVDALLGTGLGRPAEGEFARAIETINALSFPVLSLDIPSGLCSDTGNALGVAVKAALTVTFIGLKQGLFTAAGVDRVGQIVYHDLDVPERVFTGPSSPVPASNRMDIHEVSALIKPRRPSSHKGSFGHVVVVGGDYGYGGATLMAAEAALRSGAGLVSVISRSVNRSGFLARRPEIMFIGTEDPDETSGLISALLERASVIVVGPGLGKTDWSGEMLQAALKIQAARETPLVVDADALNQLVNLARSGPDAGLKRDTWILTPHVGEAARLLDCGAIEIQADRFDAVQRLQQRWGGVVLLKGAGSLVCYQAGQNQQIDLCTEGNPGMASGGMGDVLSGLIGGLVAQGYSLVESLRVGVAVHGESADLAAADNGQRGLAATDLLPWIRRLVNPAQQG